MDKVNTKFITSSEAPLVVEQVNNKMELPKFLNLLTEENGYFKTNLLKHGALLFRNFPIKNELDFSAVIEALQTGKFINYIGGDNPRKKITKGVYTSTEASPSMLLPLHNELSYFKHYPSHIYFYCDITPKADGETIIGDSRKIYGALDKDVR